MSKPSEATFLAMSWGVSSKAIRTPGSLYSRTPRTRNSIPSMVLPQPGPPQMIVVRPLGRPPPLISSSPRIPVGDFRIGESDFGVGESARTEAVFFPAIEGTAQSEKGFLSANKLD